GFESPLGHQALGSGGYPPESRKRKAADWRPFAFACPIDSSMISLLHSVPKRGLEPGPRRAAPWIGARHNPVRRPYDLADISRVPCVTPCLCSWVGRRLRPLRRAIA